MSLRALADRVRPPKPTFGYLSHIENGRATPSQELLERLEEVLQIPLRRLEGEAPLAHGPVKKALRVDSHDDHVDLSEELKTVHSGLAEYALAPRRAGPCDGEVESYVARIKHVNATGLPESIGAFLIPGNDVVIRLPTVSAKSSDPFNEARIQEINDRLKAEEELRRKFAGARAVLPLIDSGQLTWWKAPNPGKPEQVTPLQRRALKLSFLVEPVRPASLRDYASARLAPTERAAFTGVSSERDYLALARQLVEALLEVHRRQETHGNLNPDSIFVTPATRTTATPDSPSTQIVLSDFSILDETDDENLRYPSLGRRRGYVAPEGPGTVGADIYALGGVLFFLATGRDPQFPDDRALQTKDEIKQFVVAELASDIGLSSTNPGIADIIAWCMRFHQRDRPMHLNWVLRHLDAFALDEPEKPNSVLSDLAKWSNTKPPINPLFTLMVRHRIAELNRVLKGMQDNVYDVWGDHETIVSALTDHLSLLRKDSIYMTLTVPAFWREDNVGVNGRFMSMNKLAVIRGASIRRVFLITPEEEYKREVQLMLATHSEAIRELRALGHGPQGSDPLDGGGYRAAILRVSAAERREMMRKELHFGVVSRAAPGIESEDSSESHDPSTSYDSSTPHVMLMKPVYGKDDVLVTVQFQLNPPVGRDLQSAVAAYLSEGEELGVRENS